MSKAIVKERTSLFNLKAAMVLALNRDEEKVLWWEGVVNDPDGNPVVVCQVPMDDKGKNITKAHKVILGYGLTAKAIQGNYTLLAIPADDLVHDLPKRVTRKSYGDDTSPHYSWKKEVTARLDLIGCEYVKMEFSGAGDSANDDEWDASRTSSMWWPSNWDDGGRHWYKASKYELPEDLTELISQYVWETLVRVDIVNNDGGSGDLEIDLSGDEPVFTLNVRVNEMITHNEICGVEI